MGRSLIPGVGGVPSADIAVPEHEREVRFYSRVLSTGESPFWREDLMNNRGEPIIGLGPSSPEYAHLPLQWMPHIQVADVAASVECALDRGGTELVHAKDDDHNSQWAVLLDPSGAAFGIIPVVSAGAVHPTDGTAARAGCISWLDLTVSDALSTSEFYSHVIGWSVQEVEMEDEEGHYAHYDMLGPDGSPAARVRHARDANVGLPSAWIIYLPVGDLDESVRRAREEGGKIIKGPRGNDGAVVEDLVGACFGLVRG